MKNVSNWKKEDAVSFIECCMIWIGMGFHPDTPMNGYVDGDGFPTFTVGDAMHNQTKLDKAFELLGDDIYEVGMELGYKLGYYPRPDDQTREEESKEGQYSGVGFTFNLDISGYLEREGVEKMPSDMWDEIEEDVAARAHEMMKEGYWSGELCVSYNDDEFYGWWYSK